MKPVRVLVADDQAQVRSGIRELLEGIDDVAVVAEAGDGPQALRLIEAHTPDIVFLDINMPGLSGFDVLARMARQFPEVRAIVLTVHDAEEYVIRALNLGAMGYLAKSAAGPELEQAIKTVTRNEKYVSAELSSRMFLATANEVAPGRSPLQNQLPGSSRRCG